MKFEFTPPAASTSEKVRLEIPASILSWADGVAQSKNATREAVLEQAVIFAHTSATKPARVRKGK